MPEFDPEKFLNTPIYAFDFQFMIGDAKDFLYFSASNIDSQRQCELQAIAHRKDWDQFPSDYREHLAENVNHRFRKRTHSTMKPIIKQRPFLIISISQLVGYAY